MEDNKMKISVFGNGAREAIIAEKLSSQFSIYAVMSVPNPSIIDIVDNTHGKYIVEPNYNIDRIIKFHQDNNIIMSCIQQDNLLADGMVDILQKNNIKVFGATKAASQLEWDKNFALNIIRYICPEALPKSLTLRNFDENRFNDFLNNFGWENTVVKPIVLTGGKGVKIGNEHFKSKNELEQYSKECIERDSSVILQERINGYEFTIMSFCDGDNLFFMQPTYDYPYRFTNDKGPGTGGMGCVTFSDGKLPFLTTEDIKTCHNIMKKTIQYLKEHYDISFVGCLNGGFFKTSSGIKFMEYNARLGDPEALNVLTILDSRFADIVYHILSGESIKEIEKEIVTPPQTIFVEYIVNKNYGTNTIEPVIFNLPESFITDLNNKNIKYYCASMIKEKNKYQTVGNSRTFALVCSSNDSIQNQRKNILKILEQNKETLYGLDWRTDIGKIPLYGITDSKHIAIKTKKLGIREEIISNEFHKFGYDVTICIKELDDSIDILPFEGISIVDYETPIDNIPVLYDSTSHYNCK